MPQTQHFDTHRKALTINLDSTIYGTLAEIGAGQEVARWFLQAGAASGTVAKTMSAYDMTFSDAIYGKVPRYVSRQRLEGMLEHEYRLLIERLGAPRGPQSRFFVFADTISARNYAGTNECHGWMGIRFEPEPGVEPSEIVLHVNLLESTNLHQQRTVGVLGVNLIFAAFHRRGSVPQFLAALFEDLSLNRVEIDLIAFRGPAFADVDEYTAMLELVQGGFAEVVVFPGDRRLVPPDEAFHKRPLVFEPGVFTHPIPIQYSTLATAQRRLAAELDPKEREPLALFALTNRRPGQSDAADTAELRERLNRLLDFGAGVVVPRRPEIYHFVHHALRYTSAPVRITISALALAEVFHERHYLNLQGQLLEGLARLFTHNVKIFVHPVPGVEVRSANPAIADWLGVPDGSGLITQDDIELPPPVSHLFRYLVEAGFLHSLPDE